MNLPVGYRVPHPLVFDVHIKVETMDHSTTPIKVFETALEDLSVEVDILTRKFDVSKLSTLLYRRREHHDTYPCPFMLTSLDGPRTRGVAVV